MVEVKPVVKELVDENVNGERRKFQLSASRVVEKPSVGKNDEKRNRMGPYRNARQ